MATTAPTLDIRVTLPARLEELGMNQGFFAELCGLNKIEFSRLMNGAKPLSNIQTEKFYAMLDALDRLAELFDPMPIAWRGPEAIRDLLKSNDLMPERAKQDLRNGLEFLRGGSGSKGKWEQ